MKTILATLVILAALVTAKAQTVITNTGCVEIAWDLPATYQATESYVLYHTTNYTAPVWPLFPGWQIIAATTNNITTNAQINVPVGQHFFFMVSSNAWGVSTNSNVISTPVAPGDPPVTLRVSALSQLPCP